jgi:hypothetical protein
VPEAAAGEEPLQWEVPGEGMREHASEAAGPATGPREAVSGEGVEHLHAPVEDVVAQMTDLSHDASEQDRLRLEPHLPRDVDPDN